MDPRKITNLIKRFSEKKIFVIGDLILDLYIEGKVDRISPEAPVPVVLEKKREYMLGGAANVAANVASLGAQTFLFGVLGFDKQAGIFNKICQKNKIKLFSVTDKARPTTQKTRLIADGHQLARLDRENTSSLKYSLESKLVKKIKSLPAPDLIIFSDYNKGTLTLSFTSSLKKIFSKKVIIADTKPSRAFLYKNVFALSPNTKEAEAISGIEIRNNPSAALAAKTISKKLSTSIFLTRGEDGITVFDKKTKKTHHLPSKALSVFDVTGAGDTVMAALSLVLSESPDLITAATLANLAAAHVVSKPGTACISSSALISLVLNNE